MGSRIEEHPGIAKQAAERGHIIGNHSYSHPYLCKLSMESFWKDEVGRTQEIFEKTFGFLLSFFRPPFGDISDEQIELIAGKGMKIIAWAIDMQDWLFNMQASGDDKIIDMVAKYMHPEAIIMMHDGGGETRYKTVLAVDKLIPLLKLQGYEFVTVDELFDVSDRL